MFNLRNLGLDIGDKRIGVALSDSEEILASPLTTIIIDTDEKAIGTILELVDKNDVKRIVVGMPYSLDGTFGKQANKVMAFVEKLSRYTEVDIKIQDERLSTVAADRLMIEAGFKNSRRKEKRDSAAAAFILQGYLDSLKSYK